MSYARILPIIYQSYIIYPPYILFISIIYPPYIQDLLMVPLSLRQGLRAPCRIDRIDQIDQQSHRCHQFLVGKVEVVVKFPWKLSNQWFFPWFFPGKNSSTVKSKGFMGTWWPWWLNLGSMCVTPEITINRYGSRDRKVSDKKGRNVCSPRFVHTDVLDSLDQMRASVKNILTWS